MRPVLAVLPLLVTLASAVPLPSPQELSLSEFRSLRDEATPNNKVDIIDGYAKVSIKLLHNCLTLPKTALNIASESDGK